MKSLKKIVMLLLTAVLLVSSVSCSGSNGNDLFGMVMPAGEALAAAKRGNVVVCDGSVCVSGRSVWDSFCAAVEKGTPASVLCANHYILDPEHMDPELYESEKDSYPQLFFTLLEFDGEKFSYSTRMSSEKELDSSGEYAYMLHFAGEMNPQAVYDRYEYYVLVDDPDVTWKDIEHGMFSSQLGAYIPHKIVFTDMTG